MSEPAVRLSDLIDLRELQRIQDAFSGATGVASIITDVDGTPLTRPSNFCRLCIDIIRGTEKGLANCMRSDAVLGKKNPQGPIMQPCLSGGLWDGGASICVGDTHIGNWLIGQVRNEDLREQEMLAYARHIGVDEAEFRTALLEVPVMSTRQFSRVCEALFLIANQISALAFRNLALRQSEESLRTTLDSIGDAVIATDTSGVIVRMNPVAERLTGWRLDAACGLPLRRVFRTLDPATRQAPEDPVALATNSGKVFHLDRPTLLVGLDGVERRIADSAAPIQGSDGKVHGAVLVFRDVTAQAKLEEQVRHSQKMDAIGQLAGGVAHDFNNMLQGILGAAEILSHELEPGARAKHLLQIITSTANRATGLTKRMLAFSRKGGVVRAPVDVHEPIRDAINLLERGIDRRIRIVADLSASASHVLGDPGQIENLVINLGLNARDAMPEGGELRIATRDVLPSEEDRLALGQPDESAPYLEVVVRDTGCGIASEHLEHIFEPFYTTKEVGQGTGLGLASVYAAVQEHRGLIQVQSAVVSGTAFRILLPLLSVEETPVASPAAGDKGTGDVGRLLLVDDEIAVRTTVRIMLEGFGYEVIEAEDGRDGLELYKRHSDRIDLVILDMVMPRMNGREVLQALRAMGSDVPVLFCSGFSRDDRMADLLQQKGVVGFVQKPFRRDTLAEAVGKAIAPSRR